jgi:transposase
MPPKRRCPPRGRNERQAKMLLGVTPDDLVPAKHPIRRIRELVEDILEGLSPLFEQMYSDRGRPSIPPEQLLKAALLMAFYSIRSERQFCERLQYDLLFKWFVGLNITDPAFDPTTFTHNRERLLKHDVAEAFLGATVRAARYRRAVYAGAVDQYATGRASLPDTRHPCFYRVSSVCQP